MKTVTTHFKIRTKDGLFSTGGQWPSFDKKGKTWKKRAHLHCHLNQLNDDGKQYLIHGVSVVEVEVIEEINEKSAMPLTVYLDADRRKKREAWDRKVARDQLQKEQAERKLYEDLREKFEC